MNQYEVKEAFKQGALRIATPQIGVLVEIGILAVFPVAAVLRRIAEQVEEHPISPWHPGGKPGKGEESHEKRL